MSTRTAPSTRARLSAGLSTGAALPAGMSKRTVLWIGFAVVHAGVALLGFLLPNEPMGDVYRVYEPWSGCALSIGNSCASLGLPTHAIVGITEPWVYPQLALVPMVAAWLFAWLGSYTIGWAVLVTILDGLAFAALVGDGRSTGRHVAAWFWLAYAALLGPVGMYRLDGLTVPIVIVGCLWLANRPWLGSALLAVGVWIKVWPAAILAAAFLTLRRKWAIVLSAAGVSAVVLAAVALAGGWHNAFNFIGEQGERGLQVEAPVSSWYLWRAVLGFRDSSVYYAENLLTFQVKGPGVLAVVAAMTPLLAAAMAAILILGSVRAYRGASFASLFPPLSLALVTAFIVFNKVGSPQYQSWLIPPIVIGLLFDRMRWWKPATLALAIAGLTQLVYPIVYFGIITELLPVPTFLLTARNALLVVLLVWAVWLIVQVEPRGRSQVASDDLVEETA